MDKKLRVLPLLLAAILLLAFVAVGLPLIDGSPLPWQCRVACVGDSITFGLGTSDWPENSYPAELSRLLGRGFHVENFGVSGFAAQDSADHPYRSHEYYQRSLDYGPHKVIIMLGSNDAKGVNWQSREAFKAALSALVSDYARLGSEPEIYLCTPCAPFYPPELSDSLTAAHIDPALVEEAAEAVRELAAELGLPLIDINALSLTLSGHFPDFLHPDDHAASAIALTISRSLSP